MSIDHISNLPDCVLGNILSRLSLKDAVRTCVISKVWEFKWTSIYSVDFDTVDFPIELANEWNFVEIIEKVLHHLLNVRNFSLTCSAPISYDLFRMTVLVSALLRHDVKRLRLMICNTEDFFLPCSLFNVTSLRRIYVVFERPCSFIFPSKNCYPNLKHLTLERVKIVHDISHTETLIFTLPVLRVLQLIDCEWVNVMFVEIYAPSLFTFTSITPSAWDDDTYFFYSIKIFGTKLHELNTSGGYPERIRVIGSKVASANLQSSCDHPFLPAEECGLRVHMLLRELPNLEYLNIAEMQAIGEATLGLSLPTFNQLRSLLLGMRFDAQGLLELLRAAPFLKSLVISLRFYEYEYDHEYDSAEHLPSCVVHHLEEIEFDYCYVSPNPNFLVEKFFLKNGAQLKTVSMRRLDSVSENKMVEELSTFSKASECLEIVVLRLDGNRLSRRIPETVIQLIQMDVSNNRRTTQRSKSRDVTTNELDLKQIISSSLGHEMKMKFQ